MGGVFTIFDIPIQTVGIEESWGLVMEESHRAAVRIFFVDAHALLLAQDDRAYRHALQVAEFCFSEERWLTLSARFLCSPRLPTKMNRTSWIFSFFDRLQTEESLFCLGVRNESFQILPHVIASRWPRITLIGSHGSVTVAEEDALVAIIEQQAPTILLVGSDISCPERFICRHWHQLKNAGVRIAIAGGTTIDEMTGVISRPQKVAKVLHLQWCFHLIFRPKFFYECYIKGPFRFLWLLIKQKGKQEQK